MDHKIVTVCLMTSQRIGEVLGELAESRNTGSDCHIAVVAALKLVEPAYYDLGTVDIGADLKTKSTQELCTLARLIHPVMCSLKLEKWLGVSGQCHYLAQSAVPRGGKARRMLLDNTAHEIISPGSLPENGLVLPLPAGAHNSRAGSPS